MRLRAKQKVANTAITGGTCQASFQILFPSPLAALLWSGLKNALFKEVEAGMGGWCGFGVRNWVSS